MEKNNYPIDDIKVIKSIMEQSTRFLSLSGLSGISAGIIAIAGAVTAKFILAGDVLNDQNASLNFTLTALPVKTLSLLLTDAAVVLVLAISSAFFFSWRKARKSGARIWTPATVRLFLNLSIPLLAGGLFIILSLGRLEGTIVAASTLIFYGLSLVSAAKFTLGEIFWLGVMETITGLVCLVLPEFAFELWVFGFGILHIAYGTFMYLKYKG